MKGIVLAVCSIIAISLSDARSRKKPDIQIFEIRENQLTKNLNVQPVKLQYDLDSEEKELQLSKLRKILLLYKKKRSEDVSKQILKKIKALKGVQGSDKKQKQPLVLLVSPEYTDVVDSRYLSDEDRLANSFLDKTRTQDLLKPGNEVVFNIVPPNRARKNMKQAKLPPILRSVDLVEDRTGAPPSRGRDRPYDNDYGPAHHDEHY